MKNKNILILYKQSTYHHFFLTRPELSRKVKHKAIADRFIDTHLEHYRTLAKLEAFLKEQGLRYTKIIRGRQEKDFSSHNLVITVGGDGTFLEGASYVKNQLMLGINSDPLWSVGRFCYANSLTFPKIIRNILSGQAKIQTLNRLKITLKQSKKTALALNDILICHSNPAAMSRYYLQFKDKKGEQRSSGVWVATAAGSTGAIHSAGGKVLPETSKALQFVVRELYCGKGCRVRKDHAIFTANDHLKVISLMRDGVIYVDGSHHKLQFPFGEELRVKNSPQPLRLVVG